MYSPQVITSEGTTTHISHTTPQSPPQAAVSLDNQHSQQTHNVTTTAAIAATTQNGTSPTSQPHPYNEDTQHYNNNISDNNEDSKNHHKNNQTNSKNQKQKNNNILTKYEVEFGRKLAKRLGYFSIVNLLEEFIRESFSEDEIIEILDSDLDMSLGSYDVPETIVDTLPDIQCTEENTVEQHQNTTSSEINVPTQTVTEGVSNTSNQIDHSK